MRVSATLTAAAAACRQIVFVARPPEQLLRTHKLEYLHKPLDYAVTFMYAPDGPLKFKMTKRPL